MQQNKMSSLAKNCVKTALAAALSAAVFSGSVAADNLRLAGNFPTTHSSSIAMEQFKERLPELSGGELTVDVFPAMQLGGAKENIDQVRSGVLEMTWVGASYLSRIVPELEAVSLPFVYANRDEAFKVVDGPVGDMLNEKLAEKGFIALGFMELGSRHVTNSQHPIKTLADFDGLKIRLQPNETHLATFRALGASPVSMGINEVYSALQQGVIDGQENPYSVIESRKLNEVQTYLTDTSHFFDFIVVVANKRKFEKLEPSEQQAVRDAMAEAVTWQRAKAAEEDSAAREKLAANMQLVEVTPELRQQMRERTAPVIESLKERIGADLIDAVLAEAK
ncbi:TRAP transporter substrate-binding protein [Marinobacterium aestuariivivens]|uniref:TRAP transporter substrate-binding protein n=1 Tax=Marinobacterium aestuariivivens TaxID=1698799 RepID=A0ABW2A278_9GAMM